jgi:peroxiredoxin Q/BCP
MKKNDLVDDFTSTDQNGQSIQLSALLQDGPIALFFYPKAMTQG